MTVVDLKTKKRIYAPRDLVPLDKPAVTLATMPR
jgi:hypothetical protein